MEEVSSENGNGNDDECRSVYSADGIMEIRMYHAVSLHADKMDYRSMFASLCRFDYIMAY